MVVNQVSNNFNTTSYAKFSEFQQPKNGYFIMPEKPQELEDKIDRKKLYGKLGLGLILCGLTSFGLVKATPKSVIKKFDHFKKYLEQKTEEQATNSKTAIFYRTLLKTSNILGEKCQGLNNIISFKDILFKHSVTDKVPVLKQVCDGITKGFTAISRFTVKTSYKFTAKKFKNLDDVLANYERGLTAKGSQEFITINGKTRLASDWIKILGDKRKFIGQKYSTNFSPEKIEQRNQQIEKIMSTLCDKVWGASFGDLSHNIKKSNTYFTFVADKFLTVDKANFGQQIGLLRREISYNSFDKVNACRDLLNLNKRILDPKDTVSEKFYRDLNKQLSSLLSTDKNTPQYAKLKEEILGNLKSLKEGVKLGKDKYKYDDKILNAVDEHNRIFREILSSTDKGATEEMLEIYKHLLPESEYAKLKKQVMETVKSLDNSITTESVNYFDKRRDLVLGSAPTDILSMLIGFGSLGIGLASTDDKDTQRAIALKYGIPAMGGMMTSMVITSMLVAGMKSHIAGFASGIVLNRIGSATSKYLEERNKAKDNTQNTLTNS